MWLLLAALLFIGTATPLGVAAQIRAEQQDKAGFIHHDMGPYYREGVCGVGEILAKGTTLEEVVPLWEASYYHHLVIAVPWDEAALGISGDTIVVAFIKYC